VEASGTDNGHNVFDIAVGDVDIEIVAFDENSFRDFPFHVVAFGEQ